MELRLRFPLGAGGPLGRASELAARHPSYRVEGAADGARVSVLLDLPADWRLLDELSSLLRGEEVSYTADGAPVSGEELFGGLRCFLRKQRSGKTAREWCTPSSLGDRQLFPCRQIRIYAVSYTHLTLPTTPYV